MKLEFEKITMRYGKKTALENVSFTLTSGLYGLLGANGAGKSTLIHIMTQLQPTTAGMMRWNDAPIEGQRHAFLDCIGYLPQYPRFYANFRGDEFLCYMAEMKGVPKRDIPERVESLLAQVNLTDDAHRYIGQYSGGMRQRLGIAQALLNQPALLILDEPTAGLDPKERIRFRNMISQLSANRIVLLATHITGDIEAIANSVILLKKGKVLQMASPAELTAQMTGKVWQVACDCGDIASQTQPNIANVSFENGRCLLRVIADTCPAKTALPLPPRLEDAYLYFCGDIL